MNHGCNDPTPAILRTESQGPLLPGRAMRLERWRRAGVPGLSQLQPYRAAGSSSP